MVFLRCLYRRDISREMISLVARACLWLARQPPKAVDRSAVGLALFRAALEEKPPAVCAAVAAYGVTVADLLPPIGVAAAIACEPDRSGTVSLPEAAAQANLAGDALYLQALNECLNHWMDLAEVQASARSDRVLCPEHVLLAILEAEGPWKEVLGARGLSPEAIRAGLCAELAVRTGIGPAGAGALASPYPVAGWWDSPAAGVPRRFGVGGMLVIVTMFAVLYAGLQWLHAPPVVFLAAAVFFAGLALGQMLLRGGKSPRAASVKMGAILWPIEMLVLMLFLNRGNTPGPDISGLLFATIINVGIGAVLGYLGGCLVAGVVLVLDMARDLFGRLRRSGQAAEPATPPPLPTSDDPSSLAAPPGQAGQPTMPPPQTPQASP